MASLASRAWFSLAVLAAVMGLLVFGPAGTVRYWQGWLYLTVFFGASLLTTLDLMRRDPALLERRMSGGPTAEKRPAQTTRHARRVGRIHRVARRARDRPPLRLVDVPLGVVARRRRPRGGRLLLHLLRVYRENTFTSATIEIAPNQTVVSTGPYAIVRHPMYASAMLYVIGTPLALGSYWGLLAVACMLPFLIWRLSTRSGCWSRVCRVMSSTSTKSGIG